MIFILLVAYTFATAIADTLVPESSDYYIAYFWISVVPLWLLSLMWLYADAREHGRIRPMPAAFLTWLLLSIVAIAVQTLQTRPLKNALLSVTAGVLAIVGAYMAGLFVADMIAIRIPMTT